MIKVDIDDEEHAGWLHRPWTTPSPQPTPVIDVMAKGAPAKKKFAKREGLVLVLGEREGVPWHYWKKPEDILPTEKRVEGEHEEGPAPPPPPSAPPAAPKIPPGQKPVTPLPPRQFRKSTHPSMLIPGVTLKPDGTRANFTTDIHFIDGKSPWEGGVPTPERKATVHDPYVARAVDHVRTPGVSEQKRAVITMGGPGSGKGVLGSQFDRKEFVFVDPDDARENLPEWPKLTQRENSMLAVGSFTHPEASYLADEVEHKAITEGKNVVLDSTGYNLGRIKGLINRLKSEGYHVHLLMAHTTAELAKPGIRIRAQAKGRINADDAVDEYYRVIPNNMLAAAKLVDSAALFDMTQKDPISSYPLPRKVWVKHGDAGQDLEPAVMNKFRELHGDGSKEFLGGLSDKGWTELYERAEKKLEKEYGL